MKTKTFDCVDMKRKGAGRVRRALEGLTPEEVLKFWEERTQELRRLQEELRRQEEERREA